VFVVGTVALLAAGGSASGDYVFGPVKNLGPVVNGPAADGCPNVSADGLTLYFSSGRPGGLGDYDIWLSTRPSVDAAWGAPVNIGAPINSKYYDAYPCVAADGLTLYFTEHFFFNEQVGVRPPVGSTNPWDSDIWMSTRATASAPWGPAVSAGTPPNSGAVEGCGVTLSGDGLTMVFAAAFRSGGLGNVDLWMCSRTTKQEPWGPVTNLGPTVNTKSTDSGPCLSADGLALFFESNRAAGSFVGDLWMTTRKTRADPWQAPITLATPVNTSAFEWNPALSTDGRTLYFASDRAGGLGQDDLYEVSIVPVVDLNGDKVVDLVDLVTLIDNWGTDKKLCDIGPMPWGDGKVDMEDLKVLMAEWESQNPPVKP
jgi:hypothetical protein